MPSSDMLRNERRANPNGSSTAFSTDTAHASGTETKAEGRTETTGPSSLEASEFFTDAFPPQDHMHEIAEFRGSGLVKLVD